jgi:predicted outer membrane lipoprotein
MDERQTLLILGWMLGTVVVAAFILNAIALSTI